MSRSFDKAFGNFSYPSDTVTVAGSADEVNEKAIIFVLTGNANAPLGVTVDGVAATLIRVFNPIGGQFAAAYYFNNPSTSSVDYVATASDSSDSVEIHVQLYKGFDVSGGVDSSAQNSVAGALTLTTNVLGADAWLVSMARNSSTGLVTPGTGTTLRSSLFEVAFNSGDSDGDVGNGPQSMAWDADSATTFGIIVSIVTTPVFPPDVVTEAATDITHETAIFNAEITDVGLEDADERGFVWGTSPQAYPGNVAASLSSYDEFEIESGTFTAGIFDYPSTALVPATTYYVRAFAHNSDGYRYGDEVSFDTDTAPPFRFTNIPGVVFDDTDTTTIFAERLNNILERLEALE